MLKQLLTKTLLVAAGLCTGMSAWADGNKRVLDSQNYETATASDWTSANGTISLGTGDATYGSYSKVNVSGNGNRTCAKTVSFAYEAGSGYTTPDMTSNGYVIEFDMQMSGGNVKDRSVSQFFIGTSSFSVKDNATYTGSDYVFAMSQPQRDAASRVNDWYINDLNNEGTSTTIAYSTWYHYKFVVTASSVTYTISHGTTQDATGSLKVTAMPDIKGFYGLLGRGAGYIYFDNLEIYDYTAALTVTEPTFTFKKVDGANRIYTLANPDGSGKLYYTTTPAESAPAIGDEAYTSSDETSLDVTFTESGKYYAYVLHTNGTTVSPITELTVTAGELTLAEPVFTVVGMVQAEDGFYYPQVSFSSNNSTLEGTPTATFDVTSPYTFTATGSITVTASATGYTSSSNTFTVSNAYVNSKTIDFGALTANDFDPEVWTSATGAPRDYWTNRAAAIPADVTYYKLINTSATNGDPDNSAVLDGITISNYYQRAPEVYIGYGLLTPYATISGSSNNMNFTVNGATADDYAVYNGWNNYGGGTFNTILAGNATFGLYRYDTMLRTINLYSPVPADYTVSKSITDAGWATYCSPYALDFTGTGLTAYIVTGADASGVLAKVEVTTVPANTGVLLKGDEGNYNISVVANSSTDVTDNKMVGVTAETQLDAKSGWVLMNDATNGLGFYCNENTFTVGANTAYIPVDKGDFTRPDAIEAKTRFFSLDSDDATAINGIESEKNADNAAIYNLAGQRVNGGYKGIVIKNGKKVFVK